MKNVHDEINVLACIFQNDQDILDAHKMVDTDIESILFTRRNIITIFSGWYEVVLSLLTVLDHRLVFLGRLVFKYS